MDPIVIEIKEDAGINRTSEPTLVSIPLRQGELTSDQLASLHLIDESSSTSQTAQFEALSLWPDNSIRWLGTRFLASLKGHEHARLVLQVNPDPNAHPDPLFQIEECQDRGILLATENVTFQFGLDPFQWTTTANSTNAQALHRLAFHTHVEEQASFHPGGPWRLTAKGPVCVILECSGCWATPDEKPLVNLHCRVEVYPGSNCLKLETRLHNPNRARHPGGLWDLGDEGSVHFRALELTVSATEYRSARLAPESEQSPFEIDPTQTLMLYQDSSGGEAWQSVNHINAQGKSLPSFRGYRLMNESDVVATGDRATPCASIDTEHLTVHLCLAHFWQNFPSSLQLGPEGAAVGLFPEKTEDLHELQGGEQKTQVTWLSYSSAPSALSWVHAPVLPTISPRRYQDANAFPWFSANTSHDPLGHLIQEGLTGPQNFFAKREIIDEYGWRNFGDIFADHETLYQPDGDPPHVSHYNNQYDAIYGFARQFALTGDRRWFELMDDLARHVADIDIYHTNQDRSEYNNGLFWHTDHYLPACTATHRTFSRHNETSSTPGQVGGGPAAEHCYTTGLLYHYLITGAPSSRTAVLELAHWIKGLHEGKGGFLEQILALKKREVPLAVAKLKGRNPSPHNYPFTRGTGNYLNALLDAWHLEPDKGWLQTAERVIEQTIHPADDIGTRHLLDTETGWSYLVLLSAICRYLWLKAETGQIDHPYEYARRSLIHYTRWMLSNEELFLSRPEGLEFPNLTWTAQDLRKVMLFYQAASIDPDNAAEYRKTASQWLETIGESLSQSNERHFARIQIILLQNFGPHQLDRGYNFASLPFDLPASMPSPVLTWPGLTARIARRLVRAIFTFRPGKERAWLNARLDRS